MEKNTKMYTARSVYWATFLGGPLAAIYMMRRNFLALGNSEAAKKTLMYGLLATCIVSGLPMFLPESIVDNIPASAIAISYIVYVYFLMNRYQTKALTEHFQKDGAKYSFWNIFGVIALSLIILIAYVFILGILAVIFFP